MHGHDTIRPPKLLIYLQDFWKLTPTDTCVLERTPSDEAKMQETNLNRSLMVNNNEDHENR